MRMLLVLAAVAWTVLAGCKAIPLNEPESDGLEAARISGIYDTPVQLEQGRYVGEPFVPGAASRPTVTLLQEPRVAADLDGDGDPEWLVVLAESSGGGGTFFYLAVVRRNESGFHSIATELLGDRVRIEGLSAEGAIVQIDLLTAGADDARCCPTRKTSASS